MKKAIFILVSCIFFSLNTFAQNVGIGTSNPKSKLDVQGKTNLGNDNQVSNPGDIRFHSDASDFKGYDGEKWYSLTGRETRCIL